MPGTRLLSTAETAHRLGVKRETVYAYVSRGLLARHPASTRRASCFAADDVEALAQRSRHADRSGALEVVIETELTALDPAGRLAYRGRDAGQLARFRHIEDVAGLLWDGDAHAPWTLAAPDAALVERLRAALGPGTPPLEFVPVVIAGFGATPGRADRRPAAVRRAGARMLAGALQALAPDERPPAGTGAAQRLWPALATPSRSPRPVQLAALDAALVLLADHELAASTLAARVAASTWSEPYRVVLSGLGALGGPLHGAAGTASEELLRDAARDGPFAALDARIAAGVPPGFGHRVYRDRDPRADHLLGRLTTVADDPAALRTVRDLLDGADRLGLPAPNVDFALAALGHVMGLRSGSATAVFTVARIVGLIAHALEEYPHRLRFRPRATYVGPAPAG